MKELQTPKVSVILQTYQHKNYIEQCLDSILSQKTNFQFELIIGEDGSDDGTGEICKRYASKYPGIIRLFQRKREDVIYIAGRATGRFNLISNIKSVRGEYIAFIEGDDYWSDEFKLAKQAEFLDNNPDFSLCFHNTKILNPDNLKNFDKPYINSFGDKEGQKPIEHQITTFEDLIRKDWFMASSSLFFRSYIYKELPTWFTEIFSGDYAIQLLALQHGKAFFLPDVMSVYRVHQGGISVSTPKINILKVKIKEFEIYKNYFPTQFAKLFQEKELLQRYKLFKHLSLERKSIFKAAILLIKSAIKHKSMFFKIFIIDRIKRK